MLWLNTIRVSGVVLQLQQETTYPVTEEPKKKSFQIEESGS